MGALSAMGMATRFAVDVGITRVAGAGDGDGVYGAALGSATTGFRHRASLYGNRA